MPPKAKESPGKVILIQNVPKIQLAVIIHPKSILTKL